jgi:AraC-like DNA-binding protein
MNWSGKVFLWEEYGLFFGTAGSTVLHESPAIKICISLEGSFQLRTADDKPGQSYASAIIPAGHPHAIEGDGHKMAMFLLAPEGELGQLLISITSEHQISSIPEHIFNTIRREINIFENPDADEYIYEQAYISIIRRITKDFKPSAIDPRVSQSIAWIRAGRDSGILVKDIAAEVELSESRFSHLFTEHVRVPLRRYLLWLRLRDALHLLAKIESLTETAHEAGFADSAHLTRTFRSALGITPSALVKGSSVISFFKV